MEVEIPVPPDIVNVSVPLFAVVVPESAVNVSNKFCVEVLIVNVSLFASVVTVMPLPPAIVNVSDVLSASMLDCPATAIVPNTFGKVCVLLIVISSEVALVIEIFVPGLIATSSVTEFEPLNLKTWNPLLSVALSIPYVVSVFVDDIVNSFAILVIPMFVPCFKLTFCTAPALSTTCKVFEFEVAPSTALKV